MKRALSVKAITSDWCSWVADWWQAAKRRRRRSSACQLKEQLVCMRVCVRGTDKRNWQLTAGGRGWGLCVCLSVCVSFLSYLDILTMLMRDRQRTIVEFHGDSALSRWHTEQCLSLTRMQSALDQLHRNTHKSTNKLDPTLVLLLLRAIPTLKYQLSLTLIIRGPSNCLPLPT